MTLWCPECGSFHFNFTPVATELKPSYNDPEIKELVFKDHMVCKSCTFAFDIEWLETERKWWMQMNTKSERPKFRKKEYGNKRFQTTAR